MKHIPQNDQTLRKLLSGKAILMRKTWNVWQPWEADGSSVPCLLPGNH